MNLLVGTKGPEQMGTDSCLHNARCKRNILNILVRGLTCSVQGEVDAGVQIGPLFVIETNVATNFKERGPRLCAKRPFRKR